MNFKKGKRKVFSV